MFTPVPRILVLATATALASLLLVLSGGAAAAHTGLRSSAPADGETLTVAPDAVTLTFATAVSSEFAQVAVTGPDGESVTSGNPTIDGSVVSQSIAAEGDGGYVVAYRVVSNDGHPVSGQLTFTLTGTSTSTGGGTGGGAAAGSTPAEPSPVNTPAPTPDTTTAMSPAAVSGESSSRGLWLFLAAVALVFVVGTWLALRRGSGSSD